MRRKKLLTRLGIRYLALKGHLSWKDARTVLRDDDLIEETAAFLFSLAYAPAEDTPFTDWLDWLLENGPAIAEFIMMLLAIFAGKKE